MTIIHTRPLNRPGHWFSATDGLRSIEVESIDHESELGAHLFAARHLVGAASDRISSSELHDGSWLHEFTR